VQNRKRREGNAAMAEKRRFIDVWLVEPNTVYREVPFNVVTSWVEQSRLVADDMVRNSGTAQWFRVGDSPDFMPYLPQADTYRIDDETEALEAVNMDFTFRKRPDEDDDDCDMIPLIDVSLVLLVFFMLTSTAAVAGALISTPQTENGLVVGKERMYYVNIDLPDGRGTNPNFSVSIGDTAPLEADRNLPTITKVVDNLKEKIDADQAGSAEVTIRAHRDVDSGDVRELSVELAKRGITKIKSKYIAVSEKGRS
jgi:biopolymer transport protein ExbD